MCFFFVFLVAGGMVDVGYTLLCDVAGVINHVPNSTSFLLWKVETFVHIWKVGTCVHN